MRPAHLINKCQRSTSPTRLCCTYCARDLCKGAGALLLLNEAILATVVAQGDGRGLRQIRLFEETRKASGRYIGR